MAGDYLIGQCSSLDCRCKILYKVDFGQNKNIAYIRTFKVLRCKLYKASGTSI